SATTQQMAEQQLTRLPISNSTDIGLDTLHVRVAQRTAKGVSNSCAELDNTCVNATDGSHFDSESVDELAEFWVTSGIDDNAFACGRTTGVAEAVGYVVPEIEVMSRTVFVCHFGCSGSVWGRRS